MAKLKASFIFGALLLGCHHSPKNNTTAQPFPPLRDLDIPSKNPEPGDWLYEHPEPGQSFDAYQKCNPVTPTETRNKIYLQPIGEFSAAQRHIIQYTADYLTIFFDRKVAILPPLSDNIVPESSKRFQGSNKEQLLTTPILNYLQNNIPGDGLIVMAVTSKDLYPGNAYNFVFGQARTKQRVGVSSIYRYSTDLLLDSTNYQTCLRRLIKTSSHEMGHMLSCEHCTHAVCVMNGANSLQEADERPNRLCSVCLKKLQWNLKFDIPSRLKALKEYFSKHKIEKDLELAQQDLGLLE